MSHLEQISLYRFKDSVTSFDDCLRKDENGIPLTPLSSYSDLCSGKIQGKFLYSISKSTKSNKDIPWIVFANELLQEKIKISYVNSYPRGLFLYQVNIDRKACFFAMSFGLGGDNNIDKNKIIRDFGLKIAVNICSLHGIKTIQSSKADSVAIRSETQILTGAELQLFGVDYNDEFFNKIICKANSDYPYISNVSGGEKIQIKFSKSYPLSWENLEKVTKDLNKLYFSEKYKTTDFRCIDNWSYVKDIDIINSLNETLLEQLTGDKLEKFYLSFPEMLDISQFSFCYSKSDKIFDDLSLVDYLSLKKKKIPSINILKREIVFLYDNVLEKKYRSSSVYNCLVAEIRHKDKDTYILFDGHWRKISKDFRCSIENYFRKNNIDFDDDYLKKDLKNNVNIKNNKNEYREDIFNTECVNNNPNLILFDKAKIQIAGEHKYEICDILSSNKDLVHVKKFKIGASSLSHLFTQVKFYSEAILVDNRTRETARDFITNSISDFNSINYGKDRSRFVCIFDPNIRPTTSEFTVVLCILSQSPIRIQDLPFMTQYEIKHVDDYLRRFLGYKIKYVNRNYQL